MTKLMVLLSWGASRFVVPKRVVAREKDWGVVKDAETKRAARIARERQLREAYQRIAERERELYLAREAYRRETTRIVQTAQPVSGQHVSEAKRRAGETQLQLAEREFPRSIEPGAQFTTRGSLQKQAPTPLPPGASP